MGSLPLESRANNGGSRCFCSAFSTNESILASSSGLITSSSSPIASPTGHILLLKLLAVGSTGFLLLFCYFLCSRSTRLTSVLLRMPRDLVISVYLLVWRLRYASEGRAANVSVLTLTVPVNLHYMT